LIPAPGKLENRAPSVGPRARNALRRVKHSRSLGSNIRSSTREGNAMAAMIEFVCTATHPRRSDPSITLEQRAWAYCAAGARDGHQWTRIDPTAVETLRSPAGNGKPHLQTRL
jgi:hypothetical protein